MTTLAERIAAKKLAALSHIPQVVVSPQLPRETVAIAKVDVGTMSDALIADLIPKTSQETAPTVVVAPPKALTFAEKMALKKAPLATVQNVKSVEKILPTIGENVASVLNTSQQMVTGTLEPITDRIQAVQAAEVDLTNVSIEDAQAYADIKAKIDALVTMSDTPLKEAMSDLKKSLLKNPQACYLILPFDIGQMVVALRAIHNEAAVSATEDKGKGKGKKSNKPLTAEEITQAFDEI